MVLEGFTLRDFIEIAGFVVTIGAILWRLSVAITTFTLIGTQQSKEISEMKVSMDKMEQAISIIAVQDVKITALIERMNTTDTRLEQRFTRVENLVDDIRHGRGLVK